MKYSFDDLHIGKTETGRTLQTREISRPGGLTNTSWYTFAGAIVSLLNKLNTTPNTDRSRLVDHHTPQGTRPVLVYGVEVVPIYVSRKEERTKNQLLDLVKDAYTVILTTMGALDEDAQAIGKAQSAWDIDWEAFGRATVAKQKVVMPELRRLRAAITERLTKIASNP